MDYKKDARIFKAFCDENRLAILALLQSSEKCACKLLEELNIQQSTLSHHMKILCDAGIVNSRCSVSGVEVSPLDTTGSVKVSV